MDSDPFGREANGVVRYTLYRVVDDLLPVMIDLEVRDMAHEEACLVKLRALWTGPGGAVMRNPAARIVEAVPA